MAVVDNTDYTLYFREGHSLEKVKEYCVDALVNKKAAARRISCRYFVSWGNVSADLETSAISRTRIPKRSGKRV